MKTFFYDLNSRKSIPATYVRGGTSRAVIFKREDLPNKQDEWADIFRTVLGSPDPDAKQLNGLGGGITSLSKVAVLSPSTKPNVDVDYLFFQVEPKTGNILTDANCGNISSAIGPFAAEEKWVTPINGKYNVNIWNENTDKIICAEFQLDPKDNDLIEISGVSARGPKINLTFESPAGTIGDALYPTGNKIDSLKIDSNFQINVTIIDVTIPCVLVKAADLGLSGHESYQVLISNTELIGVLQKIRVQSLLFLKVVRTEKQALEDRTNIPDIIIISSTLNEETGIVARFVSCDQIHRSSPVTSSMALAAAACLKGTLAYELCSETEDGNVLIHHASGTMSVKVKVSDDGQHIISATVLRTARRIMDGCVYTTI